MTAAARKTTSKPTSKPTAKRVSKRGKQPSVPAEVLNLVDRRVAKAHAKLRAEVLEMLAGAQEIEREIRRGLEELAASNPIVAAALAAPPTPPVSDKQMAAREEFFAEVLKHNDEPSDEDVEALVRSWSE